MKKILVGISLLLVTLVFYSLDIPFLNNLALKEGTYVQVQLGGTVPEDELQPEGGTREIQNLSYLTRDWHLKYSLGYQVNSEVAVQLGYLNLVNLAADNNNLSPSYRARLALWDLAARGLLALSERITATSILGVVYATQEVTGSNDANVPNQHLSRFTGEVGLGLKYNLTENVAASLEPYVVFRNGPIRSSWFFPLGLSYTF